MQRKTFLIILPVVLAAALLAVLTGASYLWASSHTPISVPTIISYQGFLADSSGSPISGTVDLEFKIYDASSGGNEIFAETHAGVTVSDGFFSVLLGSVNPGSLTPTVFAGESRYLQVKVGSDSPLPRQRFSSVPYAFVAARANTAVTATHAVSATYASQSAQAVNATQAVSATYATHAVTATVALSVAGGSNSSGSPYGRVIVVANSGGDYTSVADAIASLSNPPSSSSRYLVWVAAGIYTETTLIDVPGYVHLQGAGPNVTQIRANRTNVNPNSNAAVMQLRNHARVSDLSVINYGASGISIAVYMLNDVTRSTVLENVTAKANGSGGTGHFAVYLNDAEPTIRRSWLSAQGASVVNTGVGSINIDGGYPQALIEHSTILGDVDQDKTCSSAGDTGIGLQLQDSAPVVRDSYICGPHRAISASQNGITRVERTYLRADAKANNALFAMTGSANILLAASQIDGAPVAKLAAGSTTSLTCIHSFKSTFVAAQDGSGVNACN